jgi:hypothetical protein
MVVCGQSFSPDVLERIGAMLKAEPHLSRRALLQRYHHLGAGPLCGAQVRYLVRSDHEGIVGAAAFSAAA